MGKLVRPFLFLSLLLAGCKSSVIESRPTSPFLQIEFSITQKAHVKLTVENMYNTVVATPVDMDLPAGNHSVNFKITNLTSGVYYYIMEAKGIDNIYYEKSTSNFTVALL